MDCSELIELFTDYIDGVLPSHQVRAVEVHLSTCASCRRYKTVLEHGSSLLQTLPRAELREDFGPRLQHRLLHVQDEGSLSDRVASGTPALTVLGVAVLIAAVAWAPILRASAPVVELPPIVVDHPPALRPSPASGIIDAPIRVDDEKDLDVDLWSDARLFDYSELNRGYHSDPRPRQVGLGPSR